MLEKDKLKGEIHFFRNHEPRNWDEYRFSKWRQIRCRLTIDKIVRMAGDTDILFLDHVRAHVRHITNRIKHRKLAIIDGGADAIRVNAMRHIQAFQKRQSDNPSLLRSIKDNIRERFFGWDIRKMPSVTFLPRTISTSLHSTISSRTITDTLRQWTSGGQDADNAYLLGQPLIEDGYMEPEIYFSYVDRIKQYLGAGLIYAPQPRESEETVRIINERNGI